MKISKVEKLDIKNIASLAVQVWLDTYAVEGIRTSFSNYIWDDLTPSQFEKRLKEQDREIYKAEIENHLVGFIEINYSSTELDSANSVEIEKLYIQQNFQNQKIGSELIQFAEAIFRKKGITKYWLSVYEKNEKAIQFYQKHDFLENSEIFFELENEKHRNLVLSKTLKL